MKFELGHHIGCGVVEEELQLVGGIGECVDGISECVCVCFCCVCYVWWRRWTCRVQLRGLIWCRWLGSCSNYKIVFN